MKHMPAKQVARQRWMRAYESKIVALDPTANGRIDWQTAEYFYSIGADPEDQAAKQVAQGRAKRRQSDNW